MIKDVIIVRTSTQIQRKRVSYFSTIINDIATDGCAESMINAEMITNVRHNISFCAMDLFCRNYIYITALFYILYLQY